MKASLRLLLWAFSGSLLVAQRAVAPTPPLQPQTADPSRNVFALPQVSATTLSGRVTMEDNVAPPGQVLIERFCSDGTVIAIAATDAKGRFGADLSKSYNELENRVAGRPNEQNPLVGCKIRGVLGGYSSDEIDLGKFRLAASNEVGTLVLHKRGGGAGTSVSETTQGAPKEARKNYEKARELLSKKDRAEDAQKNLAKAVALYPQFAAAWNDLGDLYAEKGALAEARNAYRSAIGADARFVPPLDGLASVAAREEKWDEVIQLTSEAIRLDPMDFPRAYFLNGMAKYRARDFDAAEKSTREAIKTDVLRQYPQAQFQLGLILMMKKDIAGAAEQMRAFLAANPNSDDAPLARRQLADLDEKLKNAKK